MNKVTPYYEIERKAAIARKIVAQINQHAKTEYTYNEFNKKLCNGLSLDDCQRICWRIAEEYTTEGNKRLAEVARSVPLFVFATLGKDDACAFVERWAEFQQQEGQKTEV